MVPDDFLDDEVEELFREVGVEPGGFRQAAQPRDLGRLACRVGGRKSMGRFVFSRRLGAFKTLRKQMNQGGIDIVNAFSQAQ